MRKNSSHFLTREAFSFIELLCVVAMLVIISYHAFPRFFVSESLCMYELRLRLQKANDEFLKLYTKQVIQNQKPDTQSVFKELLQGKDPQCYFEYKKQRLVAHIGKNTLSFVIEPKNLAYKPKIYCHLSNELCRTFWGKKLKK